MSRVPARLLVVDDEEALMSALCSTLQQEGFVTTGCVTAEQAMQALRSARHDLLLTDMTMPGTGGLALARAALAYDPQMVAVMMTGQGTIESAVEAMQAGVVDYVLKPFKLQTMLPVLERALEVRRLRVENAALQDQLLKRTNELETANRELEAYAATVSHDLRAPLRGIDALAQLLTRQLDPVMTTDARRLMDLIGSRAQRAQALVEDLLRLSRVGRQPLVRVDVDVGRMAAEVGAEAVGGLGHEPARLVVQAGMPVAFADEKLLRQVFVNLLQNAFKFTRDTLDACVEVGGHVADGCRVYFVRDNGPGFDMAQSGNLFMPFERLRGAERHEGSGVGLSIVQRIVERHGGHVWAQAAPGQGACFYFTLDAGSAAH